MVYGEDNRKDKTAFDIATKEQIDNNENFHNIVHKITNSFPDDNFLILVENIALGEALEQKIDGSAFIFGKTSIKKRNETLKKFENKELRVLIGSKILKRGLDVKGGIDNVVIAASSKKYAELEQKVGRALRNNSRGWARIFDFYIVSNNYLYDHSRKRLKRMIQLGYPTQVITTKKTLDGKDVLKTGFNIGRYI